MSSKFKKANKLNKIIRLAEEEIQKIAAGEVVERPASIVKELVENSLDAQATEITICINGGGQSLIEVSDNGFGMSPEDAKNSVLPHWTSKITTVEDLFALNSFGFRGEALASINAVSELTLITKSAKEPTDSAIKLDFKFGILKSEESVSRPSGTTISIKNLFDNTPVRKKFLKQTETEFGQIFTIIQQFAVANSNVGFHVYKDGKMFLKAPGVEAQKDRICQLWDYSLSEALVEINNVEQDMEICGLISDGSQSRYSRSGILLFVNARPVKDQKLTQSILSGYQERLPEGRFPVCFVFLNVDPTKIDVNIHPRKEQVRFSNYTKIYTFLKETIKCGLESNVSTQIKTSPKIEAFPWHMASEKNNEFLDQSYSDRSIQPVFQFQGQENEGSNFSDHFIPDLPSQKNYDFKSFISNENAETNNFSIQNQPLKQSQNYGKIIGQLMNTFILIEKEDALVIVDQHAAHERIIYEKMKKNNLKIDGTKLIFQELLSLDADQIDLLVSEKSIFSNFGIELDKFSKTQIVLSSSPCGLGSAETVKIIKDLLTSLDIQDAKNIESKEFLNKISQELHAQIACKSAVKAGDPMDRQSIEQLLSDLETTENRFQCIHGRPTIWKIDKDSLYKRFLRPI